jgi:hypothetical protein
MELESIENCPRQSQGDSRVLRNPGNPDDCEIKMTLKIKPVVAPFVSGLFIGEDASNENYQIVVGGAVLSERIDP